METLNRKAEDRLVQIGSNGKNKTMEELTKQVAKGAGITFTGGILGRALLYVSLLIIARLLGAELFGIYSLGFGVFTFFALLARMGLDCGVVRYVSIYKGNEDRGRVKGVIAQSLIFSFLIGVGVGTILYFGSGWIAITFFRKEGLEDVIKLFSFGVPFMSTVLVAVEATRGFQKMQYPVYVTNIFQPLAKLCLILILFWFGFRLYGVIWATVISVVSGLLLALFYIRKLFPEIIGIIKPIYETKKLMKFSIILFFTCLAGFFFMWTDVLMLGYFHSASKVGVYRAASQTALLLVMILSAFTSIFAPIAGELYAKKEMDKLNGLLKIVTKWGLYISLPIFLIMAYLAKEILSIFGSQFTDGWQVLVILISAQFVYVGIGDMGWVLVMCGMRNLWFYIITVIATMNIALNFLTIPKYGMIGAAVATGISIVGIHLAGLIAVRYSLNLFPLDRRYLKGLAAGFVAFIVAYAFKSINVNQDSIMFPLFFSFAVIGVYIMMLYLLRLDEEDKTILRDLRGKALIFLRRDGYAN